MPVETGENDLLECHNFVLGRYESWFTALETTAGQKEAIFPQLASGNEINCLVQMLKDEWIQKNEQICIWRKPGNSFGWGQGVCSEKDLSPEVNWKFLL